MSGLVRTHFITVTIDAIQTTITYPQDNIRIIVCLNLIYC